MVEISSHNEFEKWLGKEIGISDYLQITQKQINQFADATLDHQWIHTDSEKAKNSTFGNTIAHGYLMLSITPYLWQQIAKITNTKMMINYGIDNMKFNQPVLVNDEVRLRVKVKSLLNLRGITKVTLDVVLEIKNNSKSAFKASLTFLYHFI